MSTNGVIPAYMEKLSRVMEPGREYTLAELYQLLPEDRDFNSCYGRHMDMKHSRVNSAIQRMRLLGQIKTHVKAPRAGNPQRYSR